MADDLSERKWTEDERLLVEQVADQLSLALENARLFHETTQSQSQLSEALRIGRMGYFEYDLTDGILTLTDEMLLLVDSSRELEGGNRFPFREMMKKYVYREDMPLILKAITELSKHPEQHRLTQEIRFKRRSGNVIWVQTLYTIEADRQVQYTKIIGSAQDITERKTNELTQSAITQIAESALTAANLKELSTLASSLLEYAKDGKG